MKCSSISQNFYLYFKLLFGRHKNYPRKNKGKDCGFVTVQCECDSTLTNTLTSRPYITCSYHFCKKKKKKKLKGNFFITYFFKKGLYLEFRSDLMHCSMRKIRTPTPQNVCMCTCASTPLAACTARVHTPPLSFPFLYTDNTYPLPKTGVPASKPLHSRLSVATNILPRSTH